MTTDTVAEPFAISSELRRLRLDKSLSQAGLAARAGIAQTRVSEYETGVYSPMLETRQRLARGLDVPLARLIPA
jgi:transcriptional regulator with XRE-family HTH domain